MSKVGEISFNARMSQNVGTAKLSQEEAGSIFSNNELKSDALGEMEGLSVQQTEQTTPKKIDKHDKTILAKAPSCEIEIAGKKQKATLVVDLSENRLYRYDNEGKAFEVYSVASGKKTSPTSTGIRKVSHIETYPYTEAPAGTKRRKSPKAYGPKILILTTIDKKTGKNMGSNGEFIHGNNNPASIGTYASHGCIRMDNDVIVQLSKEVKPGSYVLIQK